LDIIWEKSTNILKESISQQNFETWIKPIRTLALDGDQLHLSVPNKFFKDWLLENYLVIIREALINASGYPIDVNFVISPDQDKTQTDSPEQSPAHPAQEIPHRKSSRPKLPQSLNLNYSFERFVVGSCNQFAHAASVAVAEQPAKNYNPLFIYGGVGLGKTHLLNAIGIHTLSLYPDKNVVYVSAEEFMNELINSIRYDHMPQFREKYRNIDSLLIDDIQFIAGKERTQEEFFHTFNTLHDSAKQIVVTSDKFPRDIPNLESRLRSRFEWGLIADIQPPAIEDKIAIINKKAMENGMNIPSDVSHYIATQAESNIRELEGFLIRIGAYSSLTKREIAMDLVKEVLKNIIKQNEKEDISIEEIVKVVAGKLNVKITDVKSQKKNKNLALSRQIAMYLARKLTSASFPDIGEKIGGRDHSTVIYSNNKIKKTLESNPKMKQLVEEIEETLLHKH
jgi:chromosomal replication initiator protein